MILYYAVGGGLGHLTRGRRVIDALGLASEAVLVTASPYADDPRVCGSLPVARVPRSLEGDADAHRAWLVELLAKLGARRILADTFPAGIQGELAGLDVTIDLVARLVRWDAYLAAVPRDLPRLDTTWVVEELTPEQDSYVRAHSRRVVPLDLSPAPVPIAQDERDPFWLVVHSGPEDEVRELVAYTEELRAMSSEAPRRVLVVSRCAVPLPGGFEPVDVYPVSSLYASASKIISAAGFNVMLETEAWRDKHEVVPFPRQFDDQYARAARRRRNTRLSSASAPAPAAAM